MDPALFVAVVCTNDKDAIIKYISQCRVAFVEYTVLDECCNNLSWREMRSYGLIRQRVVVIYCRRFDTTYRSHPQGSRMQSLDSGIQVIS